MNSKEDYFDDQGDYQDKLKSWPESEEEQQELLDELRIHAALEQDQEVSQEELSQLLYKAKRGTIAQVKKSNPVWSYLIASLLIGFPILGLATLTLTNIEDQGFEANRGPQVVMKEFKAPPFVKAEQYEPRENSPAEQLDALGDTPAKPLVIEDSKLTEFGYIDSIEMAEEEPELAYKLDVIIPMDTSVVSAPPPSNLPLLSPESLKSSKEFRVRTRSATAGVRGTQYSLEGAEENLYANREVYEKIQEKGFVEVSKDPKSTISVDVDTASYSNLRRHLNEGAMPPLDAVRLEEMINYFEYGYAQPKGDMPFSLTTRLEPTPWNDKTRLLHIGLQGKKATERPEANLVFLLDVSGSMNQRDKLPLLKRGFKLMLDNLSPTDRVSIVAYAGHTGVVLMPTSVSERSKIDEAIDQLIASGSTNGEGGIQLAYRLAKDHYIEKGINRVILATDGDFNVGIHQVDQLESFIAEKRKTGVELSVLGFGQGNIRDDIMERLANHGNGNYAYIDSISEARKALVSQLDATLVTIAKDVKLQLDFNPDVVKSFRQIGYENRTLEHKDFDDDKKDAGEIGAGHSVTALYEIEFQESMFDSKHLGSLALRYKAPKADVSQRVDMLLSETLEFRDEVTWASVVAAFGQVLRKSTYVSEMDPKKILPMAIRAKGADVYGYRSEAIKLIQAMIDLNSTQAPLVDPYPKWEKRNK